MLTLEFGDLTRELFVLAPEASEFRTQLLRLLRWRVWVQEKLQPTEWQVTLIWAAIVGVLGALTSIGFTTLTERIHTWFGGTDRSEASMDEFFKWLGAKKSAGIRMAVMDMWKPFRNATQAHAPRAAILFDKFHIMRHLGKALDEVRKSGVSKVSAVDSSNVTPFPFPVYTPGDSGPRGK